MGAKLPVESPTASGLFRAVAGVATVVAGPPEIADGNPRAGQPPTQTEGKGALDT